MDTTKKLAVSISVAALSAALIVVFRATPGGRLWEGWRVVYVAGGADVSHAERVLSDAGCGEVISLAGQRLPALFPAASPEFSLALSDMLSGGDGYLARRALYFSDGSGAYQVYYVPERNIRAAEDAVGTFQDDGFESGMDAQSVYPFAVPLVSILFALALCIFSARRPVFFLASLIPALYSICAPFYPAAAATCLLLYALLLVMQVWGRRGAVRFLFTNVMSLSFIAGAAALAWLASLRCGALFTLALAGSVSVLYALSCAERLRDRRYGFNALPIRPARVMPLVTEKSTAALAACAAGIFLLFVASIFAVSFFQTFFSRPSISSMPSIGFSDFSHSSNRGVRVRLPSPNAGGAGGRLPSLDDYVAWRWNAATMPYRSLNDAAQERQNPKEGDTISFSQYVDGGDGIREIVVTMRYDRNFYDDALSEIDRLPYPAVEKLMKAQGAGLDAGYAFAQPEAGGAFHSMLTLFALCVPALSFLRMRIAKNKMAGVAIK